MNAIQVQLNFTLKDFELDSLIGEHYRGKVRDNYYFDNKFLISLTP